MRKFAGWMFDHRWVVLAAWLVALLACIGLARAVGPEYRFDIEITGSESLQGIEVLSEYTPQQGDTLTLAWKTPNGATGPDSTSVQNLLTKLQENPEVASVTSPFNTPTAVASNFVNGDIGTATIVLKDDALTVEADVVRGIVAEVEASNKDGTQVGILGQSVSQSATPEPTASEAIGFAFAAVVLVLAFGSLLAAALPLGGALVALGVSASVVTLATHVVSIPVFAPQLVALIGIGVGIDYALFVVSRHRAGLLAGKSVRESTLDAMDTSGRAVLFAGVTVMISILGLLVVGLEFLNGLAYAVTIAVAATMAVTVTAMPAALSVLGTRVLSRKARVRAAAAAQARNAGQVASDGEEVSTKWGAWSAHIQARPVRWIVASLAILAILAIPVGSMRLGNADAGTDPADSTTRIAYDLVGEGFGPGRNGTLLLVSEKGNPEAVQEVLDAQTGNPLIASSGPVSVSEDGQVAYVNIVPTTGPGEEGTEELINELRASSAQLGAPVYVSGSPAVFYDFASDLKGKLWWFLLGVLGLSSLLLLVAFRSIAIPIKAAVMNLLAAAATFGVLTAVFQWGWFANWLGVEPGPVDAFAPVMLLAILFGLSMDYQVFLVSRMKEEYSATKDNAYAVRMGLAETGRVITAAAMIMIVVFASFVFGGERIIKLFGLGLAVAIFLDAFVIRSLLVPALMQVLGKANWWIPAWLDRILPKVSIEPSQVRSAQPEQTGTEVDAVPVGARASVDGSAGEVGVSADGQGPKTEPGKPPETGR